MLSKKCAARRALATSLRSPVTHIDGPKCNGTFLGDLLFASGRALSSSFLLKPLPPTLSVNRTSRTRSRIHAEDTCRCISTFTSFANARDAG